MSAVERLYAAWGGVALIEGDPPIDRRKDVLYLPYRQDRAWGLFDRHGLGLPSAFEYLPQGAAMEPGFIAYRLEQPLAVEAVAAEPRRGEVHYGGRLHLHFGHFLIETLPRLWPLLRRRRGPIVMHGPDELAAAFALPWLGSILGALRLRRDDFQCPGQPTRFARMTLPEPSLRPQSHVHPAYGALCRAIGARLLDDLDLRRNDRPVYLSKTRLAGGVARIANEAEVEAVLVRSGVEIVHPEALPLPQQIALFRTRPAILGMLGSAFHVSAFTPATPRMIRLSPVRVINANHLLLDRLSGSEAVYLHQAGTEPIAEPGPFTASFRLPDPASAARAMLDAL